ncbi:MAG TPA: transposase [Myxococcaceae bacterium]
MHENNREGLERLGARDPLSLQRLSVLPDGQLCYRMKRPSSSGATQLVLTPTAFLRRLASIVPPPSTNLVRSPVSSPPALAFARWGVPRKPAAAQEVSGSGPAVPARPSPPASKEHLRLPLQAPPLRSRPGLSPACAVRLTLQVHPNLTHAGPAPRRAWTPPPSARCADTRRGPHPPSRPSSLPPPPLLLPLPSPPKAAHRSLDPHLHSPRRLLLAAVREGHGHLIRHRLPSLLRARIPPTARGSRQASIERAAAGGSS